MSKHPKTDVLTLHARPGPLVSDSQPLTELQLALLSVLWERGEETTAAICDALRPERILAHTTVATLLSRLERRGLIRHRRRGRHYVYRPVVSREDVRRSMVSGLTESLFGGDATALLTHLVSDHEVDAAELDRVRRLIRRAEAEEAGPESGGRGKGGDS